jgi:hypothetical protein
MKTYTQVYKDAGLYREWITEHFGGVLVYGGMGGSYNEARIHIRNLAKLTGLDFEIVRADIIKDFTERGC